jgi:hypothetical protein
VLPDRFREALAAAEGFSGTEATTTEDILLDRRRDILANDKETIH